jgi:16S rRNA (adenine1518-N6/adenine1519-N6)-dimethyltransferase
VGKFIAKKSLGQHFLKDKNILRKIALSVKPSEYDFIVEIGPGLGALTEFLLERRIKYLISIDIDKRVIEYLKNKFKNELSDNFSIVHSDIRDINLKLLPEIKNTKSQKVKIVGNIPYNISADIFFWIFDQSYMIESAVLMVQKEVAERLVSEPGTKSYGILSVAVDLIGKAKMLFDVSPECFHPVPNVRSTVIEIVPEEKKYKKIEFSEIMKLVKTLFNQRRKTLKNNIKRFCIENNIEFDNLINLYEPSEKFFGKRAERLSSEEFVGIYNSIKTLKGN